MKHFFYRSFVFITTVTCLVYFLAALTPYISPVHFWPMSFLALGFPYVAVCLLLLVVAWLFVKRKATLFLLVLFLCGFQNLKATLALNFFSGKQENAERTDLRIMTWNIRSFDTPSELVFTPNSIQKKMYRYIDSVRPDIVCLQEFVHVNGDIFYANIDFMDSLGYHYYYFPFQRNNAYGFGVIRQGSAIFSRLPYISYGKTMLGDSSYPEYLLYTDFLYQNKPLRVYTGHFKSIHLFQNKPDPYTPTPLHYDTSFVYTAGQFTKLKVFGQEHAKQAAIAKRVLDSSAYPLILGMDMNSVPTSYAYHHMQAGLQDAFVTKGSGLGTTLDSLPSTLRIDYFLLDKKFTIKKYALAPLHLSDHFPQVIDISWKR